VFSNNLADSVVYVGLDGDPLTDKIFTVEANSNSGFSNLRVQRLDAGGNFERMWGRNVDASNPSTGYEICTVASACQAPPQVTAIGSLKGEFNIPTGLAVDQVNGWVYVYDRTNFRVQKFDLDGNFILAFGKGVNTTTGGDVCTEASGDVCGAGSSGPAAAQLGSFNQLGIRGLAVHPTSGDVFVADPQNRRVLQYQSDGSFLRGWGFGVDTGAAQFQTCTTASACQAANAAGLANGQFSNNSPLGLAIDSQGVVYATDAASGTSAQRIVRFDSDLAPTEPGPPFPDASGALLALVNPTGVGGPLLATTTTTTGLEIDPDTDAAGPDEESLLALRDPNTPSTANTVVQELDIPTSAGELPADPVTVVETHVFAPQPINGIGVDPATGNILLSTPAYNSTAFPQCFADFGATSCAGLVALATTPGTPAAVAGVPANVAADVAALSGSVDPSGGVTSYRFEVSDTGADGDWDPVGAARYAAGSDPRSVSANATDLQPNTLYRVRLVVNKYRGLAVGTRETVVSSESTFVTDVTDPTAITLGSTARTDTSVELRGLVDPNGTSTTYRFEYGLAGGAFDRHVPVPDAAAGSGNTAELVVQHLGGLLRATDYHYRVVATNLGGVSSGDPVTFTTAANPSDSGAAAAAAYELVSPPEKVGGVGVGAWYAGIGSVANVGFAAYDGERFASTGRFGSVLSGDNGFSYGNDWVFSERSSSGWLDESPITHAASGAQSLRSINASVAADDLSTVVWRSNAGLLRPFPEMETWSETETGDLSLLGDWGGRWEPTVTDLDQLRPKTGNYRDEPVISGDGSHAVFSGWYGGLADPGDPSGRDPDTGAFWPDLVTGRTTYLADLSAGLSDSFLGAAEWSNIGVCTAGTSVPEALPSGKLDDQECPAAGPGRAAALISSRGATINSSATSVPDSQTNVITADGARVFFMSPDLDAAGVPNGTSSFCSGTGSGTSCPPQLYVRQRNSDGSVATRWVSRAENGLFGLQDASLTGQVRFEGASRDGDKVFFRTNSPLTTDDRNGTTSGAPVTTGSVSDVSWDLYMYDLPDGPDGDPATPDADPAGGGLTRISGGPEGNGDCNSPRGGGSTGTSAAGALRFVSDDGGRIYFVCAAPLPGVPLHQNGTITAPGGSVATDDFANLYLYQAQQPSGGRWRFVARIPRALPSAQAIAPCASTGQIRRNPIAPPNDIAAGLSLSAAAVVVGNCVRGTADGGFITLWTDGRLTLDDPDAESGDIYAYDAEQEELIRISAPQGGAGGAYPCAPGGSVEGVCHADGGYDGAETTGRAAKPSLGVVTEPLNAGDQIAFFQSRSRLLPDDTDSAYDVYQWRNGELSLVSTGDSETDGAFYKGNDRSGHNVYFATRDRLTWEDPVGDAVLDVYTRRVDGGFSEPEPPVLCAVMLGACQGAGGGDPTPTAPQTQQPGGVNADPGARVSVAIGRIGTRARRQAARRGVLSVRVRSNAARTLQALAKARIGRRTLRVARGTATLETPGATRIRLSLNRTARRSLRAGRRLRLTIVVNAPGARPRSTSIVLRRAGR
jgi:hypothetical protein